MLGYLINPALKSITPIECDDNSIATFLGCNILTLGANFPNGDVIYIDDNRLMKENKPDECFTVAGFGSLPGKGLLIGSDNQGASHPPMMTLEEASILVEFEINSFRSWYVDFLIRNNISMSDVVTVNMKDKKRMILISTIVDVISILPERKQDEIKILATMDELSQISPHRLLKHLAESIEVK